MAYKTIPLLYLLITNLLIIFVYNIYIIIRKYRDFSILVYFTRKLIAYSKEVSIKLAYIKVIVSGIYNRKSCI